MVSRIVRYVSYGVLAIAMIASATVAWGDSNDPSAANFRIVSPGEALISFEPALVLRSAGTVRGDERNLYAIYIGGECAQVIPLRSNWAYLKFESPVFRDQDIFGVQARRQEHPNRDQRCTLVEIKCPGGGTDCPVAVSLMSLSTASGLSASRDLIRPDYFDVFSTIAYDWSSIKVDEANQPLKDNEDKCRNITPRNAAGCDPPIVGKLLVPVGAKTPTGDELKNVVPATILGPKGVKPKVSVAASKVVLTKDKASFYANVNIAAGTGASFAWGLDGKLDEHFQKRKWIVHYLYATANGGHNTGSISGVTYSDTVDWALPVTYTQMWVSRFLNEIYLMPKYETTFELDRKNFLGSLYPSIYIVHGTQEEMASVKGLSDTAAAKFVDTPEGRYGKQFDLNLGLEGGGALTDSTQKPSKGNAPSVRIPSYQISRFCSQFHGIFEVWRFNFTDTFTGRYLFLTENSATESKAHVVYPERVSGWRGINKLSATYKEGATSHFGVTVTYQNGFDAPKFRRCNAVTAGLQIVY